MSSLHKEINLENEICEYLAGNGWLYASGDAVGYDRARAMFPADVIAWLQATQPQAWEVLSKNCGSQAEDVVLTRLRDAINQRGTLDVLRHGIELLGLRQPLALGAIQARFGDEPRHSGQVWCEPAARRAPGALFRTQRKRASIWCCFSTASRWPPPS